MDTDNLNVKEWIRRAQMDVDSASTLINTRFRPPIEVVCYLCQQAAEKILKAYMIAKTNTRSKDHVLKNLLNECKRHSTDFDNLEDNCADLTPYMSAARYPSIIELTEYDMKKALKDASSVLGFTKSKLKELGYEYLPDKT